MKTIFKYLLKERINIVEMPQGARVLDAQLQDGVPVMWAEVDTEKTNEKRLFGIVGTGWLFDASECNYISTFQADGFVWHVYERVVFPPHTEGTGL